MPSKEYEKLTDSVLAWKKNKQIGRFNPDAPSREEAKLQAFEAEIQDQGIQIGKRCKVGRVDDKTGVVKYVGEVAEIPGGGKWIGVRLDLPIGKHQGTLNGHNYFD